MEMANHNIKNKTPGNIPKPAVIFENVYVLIFTYA